MGNSKPNSATGMDWTGLLADPDLARNLGKLLQTYRDAPPERREEALLAAMREIKKEASTGSSIPAGSPTVGTRAHAATSAHAGLRDTSI